MTREQFLRLVTARHPGAQLIKVGVILREGWETDNYVAVLRHGNEGRPFMLTTDHGLLMTLSTKKMKEIIAYHQNALNDLMGIAEFVRVHNTDGNAPREYAEFFALLTAASNTD